MTKSYPNKCLERASKATEGPWEINNKYGQVWAPKSQLFISTETKITPEDYDYEAEFIAHARTDVPELARRLKRACEAMRDPLYIESPGYFRCLADELEAPLEEK